MQQKPVRSRTAEDLFKNQPLHQVRSAGTAPSARIKVSEKAIQWADLILVMEKRHKEILREKFGALIEKKEVMVLDIPDEYGYMDPELVEILEWHWEITLGFISLYPTKSKQSSQNTSTSYEADDPEDSSNIPFPGLRC